MCVLYAGVYEVGVGVAVETEGGGLPAQRAAEEEGREVEIEAGTEIEGGGETRKRRTEEGLEKGEEDQDLQGWCVLIRIFVSHHCPLS